MIKGHPIFHNDSQNPQREPSTQLAVALCRLGSNGNGAASERLRNLFSIGHGTIELYTRRVIVSILSMQNQILRWSTPEERLESSQVMQQEGFPGCIGFIDGTTIPLSQKPATDGNLYFDRKKRYSISVQLVCDINKKFISYHAGYPGSCHDSWVFQHSQIHLHPDEYFGENQYLLGDSAYASGKYLIPAFRPSACNTQDKTNFNFHLAQSRVRIEHAIGILKGRFSSLREMRSPIRNTEEMKKTIEWIRACLILHNLLANLKDQWNDLYEDDTPEIMQMIPPSNTSTQSSGIRDQILPITVAHFS